MGRSADVLRPDGSRYGPSEGREKVVCPEERKGVLKGGGCWILAWLGLKTRKQLEFLQIPAVVKLRLFERPEWETSQPSQLVSKATD